MRAIVPGVLDESQYTLPIADGFKQYPAEAFELVVGTAEGVDVDAKTVRVSVPPTPEQGPKEDRTLSYDHLVLATGTRDAEPHMPWKGSGTHEEVEAALAAIRTKLADPATRHVVVAGAGSTGVEVAAELGFAYKDKTIVLLSAGNELLGGDALSSNARAELRKLGVEVRTGARVAGSQEVDGEEGSGAGKKTEVLLDGGDKILTDLYLPTMGLVPNTEYLPASLLTEARFVDVDDHFAVKGAKDVWAAGDIVWKPRGSFVLADMQVSSPLTLAKHFKILFYFFIFC